MNYLSLWVSLYFLYVLCIPYAVSLQIATLAGSTLSAMAPGEASQILCMF